uniref:Osteopontin n=1 Tax=Gongylonema pulchrum TaxID=637853 RepID=A0A183EQ22_9BILA
LQCSEADPEHDKDSAMKESHWERGQDEKDISLAEHTTKTANTTAVSSSESNSRESPVNLEASVLEKNDKGKGNEQLEHHQDADPSQNQQLQYHDDSSHAHQDQCLAHNNVQQKYEYQSDSQNFGKQHEFPEEFYHENQQYHEAVYDQSQHQQQVEQHENSPPGNHQQQQEQSQFDQHTHADFTGSLKDELSMAVIGIADDERALHANNAAMSEYPFTVENLSPAPHDPPQSEMMEVKRNLKLDDLRKRDREITGPLDLRKSIYHPDAKLAPETRSLADVCLFHHFIIKKY